MLESSSYALAILLTAVLNPHPNIALVSNMFHENTYSFDWSQLKENTLENLYYKSNDYSLSYALHEEAKTLNMEVINKAVTALDCAKKYNIQHRQILTIIDYSLPSNQKRLWIFDLDKRKLLYHTYVGHGITSGQLLTNRFSNRNNSKATSMGVYLTEKAYHGREGMSMHLDGIDSKFNNNAANRYIVMHGGWYMDEDFIQKYGRSGRSWGCPALPEHLTSDIINTIKDRSFVVMYYPSDKWLSESKFLNCNKPKREVTQNTESLEPIDVSKAPRDKVIFAPIGKEHAIMVISAQKYRDVFNKTPPLDRMLRRRIAHEEFIALSQEELRNILSQDKKQDLFEQLQFATPIVRNERGYYVTTMEFATTDKVVNISIQNENITNPKFMVRFLSGKNMDLSISNSFIRWLGL